MRLSSRLSDTNENNGIIESFIDWEKYTLSPEEATDDNPRSDPPRTRGAGARTCQKNADGGSV